MPRAGPGPVRSSPGGWRTVTARSWFARRARAWNSTQPPANRCCGPPPHLAPHSRASVAEALASVTPELTRPTARRPPIRTLRAALYGHAFNPHRRNATLDRATASALAWLERASLLIQDLHDPRVIRRALDALALRLDGHPAAPNTITRKHAVLHNALAYAAEIGLLPRNPLDQVSWKAPAANAAVNPLTVASPAQVHAILTEVSKIRPELTAFFACLYYAALRPEEAVALRSRDLVLPARVGQADPHPRLPPHRISLDHHRQHA